MRKHWTLRGKAMNVIYHKSTRSRKLKIVEDFEPGCWVHSEKPTPEDIEFLTKKLALDPNLIEDALDRFEVPRLEDSEGVTYVYVRVPHENKDKVITVPLLIAVGSNFIATVTPESLPLFDTFTKEKIEFSTTFKVQLLLKILEHLSDLYTYYLMRISRGIRSIVSQLEDIDNKEIIQFVHFEGTLNDLLAALVPMSVIFQKLINRKSLKFYSKDRDALEDLYLSNGEHREICVTNLKSIVNIREGYSTIMSNNLNRVIKLLTMMTILLTIPMIISSLFGMNLNLPLAHSPYAFWWVLAITFAFSSLFLGIFIYKKWL